MRCCQDHLPCPQLNSVDTLYLSKVKKSFQSSPFWSGWPYYHKLNECSFGGVFNKHSFSGVLQSRYTPTSSQGLGFRYTILTLHTFYNNTTTYLKLKIESNMIQKQCAFVSLAKPLNCRYFKGKVWPNLSSIVKPQDQQ